MVAVTGVPIETPLPPPRILAGWNFLASSLGARGGIFFLDLLFAYNNISSVQARNYPATGSGTKRTSHDAIIPRGIIPDNLISEGNFRPSEVQAQNYPAAGVGQNAHPTTQLSDSGLFPQVHFPKETFVPAKYKRT